MAEPFQIERSRLGRLDRIAKGGTATIYRTPEYTLPGFPNLVYKEYNQRTREHAGPALGGGLGRFVRFRDKLPDRQKLSWDQRIIWPMIVVVDDQDGSATGIVMDLIPARFFHEFQRRSGPPERRPREIDTLFGDAETMARIGLPAIDVVTRLRLISAVANVYGMMHKQGVVVGDVSARNIMYDPDPGHPAVLVVDVDSARIQGTRAIFSTQPHTPNWEPPEALRAAARLHADKHADKSAGPSLTEDQRESLRNTWAIQSTQTDMYKFGLLVLRILDHGRGGAVSRDPTRARTLLRQHVGPDAARLLDRSLDADRKARPAMREWYEVLQGRQSSPRPAPSGATIKPTPGGAQLAAIPEGHRVGSWVWKIGTGWVRADQGPRTGRRPGPPPGPSGTTGPTGP